MKIFGRGVRCGGVMLAALAGAGCGEDPMSPADAGGTDAGAARDAGPMFDAGRDAGPMGMDAGTDTGPGDAGPGDTGPGDAGPVDAGPVDAGPADVGPSDGATDAGGAMAEIERAIAAACERIAMCYPDDYTVESCTSSTAGYVDEYTADYGIECGRAYALYLACAYEPSCDVLMDGAAWDEHLTTNCADESEAVTAACE